MTNNFIVYLKETYSQPNQPIANYQFVKWLNNGNFQYEILHKYKKSIKQDLLMLAYQTHKENPNISIDYKWLKQHGHNNWCSSTVIKTLLNMYNDHLTKKSHA